VRHVGRQTTKANNTNWATPLTNDKKKNCSVTSNNSQPETKGSKGVKYTIFHISISFVYHS
jgi:hypothetical protein